MGEPAENTPVIIGVGQVSERTNDTGYRARSPMDLAGDALATAIADSGVDAGGQARLARSIDTIGAIRQFEISRPDARAPFGRADNPPRAIARRIGADPARAILETTGGQTGQNLLGELAGEIAAGRSEVAAIAGAEAISTVRALRAAGEARDWSEHVGGSIEDRGYGLESLFDAELLQHGATSALAHYALFENARRAERGLSPQAYRQAIGDLLAPFTRVAAANPHAAAPRARTAHELAAVTDRNRIVAEPYARMTVARDQVNQGAAVIVASAGKARALGIAESRWVHVHAVAAASEPAPMERADLARSPASIAAVEAALGRCGRSFDEVRHIDLYSCFAIPVFNLTDRFDLAPGDPRGLTLTGGLPFFGGPGNNYSTHAIAEAVARARAMPGSYALVGANGGFMSKYSAALYSTEPADWSGHDRTIDLPRQPAAVPKAAGDQDRLTVETYTIVESPPGTEAGPRAIVLGRNAAGERIAANADPDDSETRALFEGGAPFGAPLRLSRAEDGRTIGKLGPA
ncbi:acetyl-CoA acetyltransferase [Pelagerythrobacter marinus]|uniref:acetyl-CoA acetyltransferase n=1 Tax=Pelagerythrobacter marinus TaxID=538382 RepID=UPI0020370CB6|nr:acetyl-CoA acetyltransferase [Pelagerythrobacter marinus]USA39419.1 acetyl-CoA acetyltransferase [Pelagerythrobacter marinus]WPZ06441.1 acetyl-CoA acetyltransferase [Pelagerythrobacter marinus]